MSRMILLGPWHWGWLGNSYNLMAISGGDLNVFVCFELHWCGLKACLVSGSMTLRSETARGGPWSKGNLKQGAWVEARRP